MSSNLDEIITGFAEKIAQTVKVKPGDTISGIAKQIGVSTQEMLNANPGVEPTRIHPGDLLKVPEGHAAPKVPSTTKPHDQHFDLAAEVSKAATSAGIDPTLLHALVQVESNGNPHADSGQAKGLTQLTPYAAKATGVADPFDPIQNLAGGAKWLANAIKEARELHNTKPNLRHALMIYHAGKGAVQQWINAGSPAAGFGQVGPLTIGYAKKVLDQANKSA
jgi:soluble lytic murein transglycosylase-like protein